MKIKNNVIYKIVNIKNNKLYIGRTINPKHRKYRHFLELRNNTHHCIYLQRSFNKYGEENFKFEIIEENLSDAEAIEREQFYLNNMSNLYNISPHAEFGGDLISNHPNREEIIKKITKSTRERYENMTQEEKLELSLKARGKNNPNYGNRKEKNPLYKKPKTKTHRENISKALSGRKLSEEHILNVKKSKKGSIPWNKGKKLKPLSAEHKLNLSKSLKGKELELKWRPVICENILFPSLKHASEFYQQLTTKVASLKISFSVVALLLTAKATSMRKQGNIKFLKQLLLIELNHQKKNGVILFTLMRIFTIKMIMKYINLKSIRTKFQKDLQGIIEV